MTENEAIKHLQSYAEVVDNMIKYCKDFEPKADITGYLEKKTVFAMAISAIKEVQQYWEIGAVKECREAVWKQKPKKRIYPKTALERYYHSPECPNCKRELKPQICGYTLPQAIGIYSYCPWCGQNLEGEEVSKRKAADVWNRRPDNETD